MSRDIFILAAGTETQVDAQGKATLPDGFWPKDMGTGAELRDVFDAVWPRIDWSDPDLGRFETDKFGIDIPLRANGFDNQIMLHTYGDITAPLAALKEATGWEMIDTANGKWIKVRADLEKGARDWEAYLERLPGRGG